MKDLLKDLEHVENAVDEKEILETIGIVTK